MSEIETAAEDAEILESLATIIERGETPNRFWPDWLRALSADLRRMAVEPAPEGETHGEDGR